MRSGRGVRFERKKLISYGEISVSFNNQYLLKNANGMFTTTESNFSQLCEISPNLTTDKLPVMKPTWQLLANLSNFPFFYFKCTKKNIFSAFSELKKMHFFNCKKKYYLILM